MSWKTSLGKIFDDDVVDVAANRKHYDRGWNDAIDGRQRKLVILQGFSDTKEKAEQAYSQGYSDGLLQKY